MKTNTKQIVIMHYMQPLPSRNYDWSAHRVPYDKDDPIGHGKDPKEALNELLELEE